MSHKKPKGVPVNPSPTPEGAKGTGQTQRVYYGWMPLCIGEDGLPYGVWAGPRRGSPTGPGFEDFPTAIIYSDRSEALHDAKAQRSVNNNERIVVKRVGFYILP